MIPSDDPLAGILLKLAMQVGSNPPAVLPPWDQANAFERAARGEVAALRTMACRAYEKVGCDDDSVAVIAWTEAITFARLAAAHGEARDHEVLLFLMCSFADWQRERGRSDIATRFEAAGLNLAGVLADAGDEDFAEMIARSGDVLPATTFEEAQRQRQQETL